MVATLVFDLKPDGSAGDLKMTTGLPEGDTIIQYVTKTLVGALDWDLDVQQAGTLINFEVVNSPITDLSGKHPHINTANNGNDDSLVRGLRALGHQISLAAQSSNTGTILCLQRADQN